MTSHNGTFRIKVKLALARRLSVKGLYTKFHINPTKGIVVDIKVTDGSGHDIRHSVLTS